VSLCWMSVDVAQDLSSRLWSVGLFIVLLSWSLVHGGPCAIVASRLVSIVLPATAIIIAEQLKRMRGSVDVLCCPNVDDERACRVREQLTVAAPVCSHVQSWGGGCSTYILAVSSVAGCSSVMVMTVSFEFR
jgi:hypothetical protein